jgi:hypothetical protein
VVTVVVVAVQAIQQQGLVLMEVIRAVVAVVAVQELLLIPVLVEMAATVMSVL